MRSAKRNPIARALRVLRPKRVPSAKVYKRKGRKALINAAVSLWGIATIPQAQGAQAINHTLDSDENHALAAEALCSKMQWESTLRSGGRERGLVFVFTDK